MPTDRLYYVNQYQRECQARVLACEEAKKGWQIILDQTVFYPTGGGQPCDFGKIGAANVLDVAEKDGKVLHLCDMPLAVGETVACSIDWNRRFMLMQQHSGEHIVSGIIHRRFGYDNVGFHMGKDTVTIDFSGELSPQELQEVEQEANETIWANIETEIFYPDKAALQTLPYRSKKELSGAIRLVKFPSIDLCACCGLHVARSGEVGIIKFLSSTRFHGGSRIELLCGGRALAWLNAICAQNSEISAALSAKPTQTASAVKRQKEELAAVQFRANALESEVFAQKAAALAGRKAALLFEPPMPSASLRKLADAVLQVCPMCFIFAGSEGSYLYAMGSSTEDMRELSRSLHAEFSGKGGGKPNFVQGSVAADPSELSSFLEQCGKL